MKSGPRIFYGWWLVLVCLLIQAVAGGVTIYTFSIFASEVESEFAASRTLVMLGLTIGNVMGGLLAPVFGGVLDRWSLKWTVIFCALFMAVGFIFMSFTPTIWGIVIGFALFLPVGSTVMISLASPVLLSRWFVRKRGLVLGIAALGTQFGGFTFPPLVSFLIDLADWRLAMQVLGLFIAIGVPLLVYFVVVDHPRQRGLAPDGDERPVTPEEETPPTTRPSVRLDALLPVLKQWNFWVVGLGVATLFGMFSAVVSNLALIAMQVNATRDQAAMLISLYAVIGMIFSPLIGRLCDLIDVRRMFASILVLSIVATLGFWMADDYRSMFIATAVIATVGGGVLPFWGAMVGRLFDIKMYGRVMGAMSLLVMVVAAGAPLLAGWIYDMTGGYELLFLSMAAAMLIPLMMAPLIHKPPLQVPA
jgi:MFS family permease